MNIENLAKELKQRGTAEVLNGVVTQVTQAIEEKDSEVSYLMFGELKKQGIIPIDEACAKCDHCHFKTIRECQTFQKKEGSARGFNQLICPQQFKE